jgi:hypothetical protein
MIFGSTVAMMLKFICTFMYFVIIKMSTCELCGHGQFWKFIIAVPYFVEYKKKITPQRRERGEYDMFKYFYLLGLSFV